MKKTLSKKTVSKALSEEYGGLIGGIAELLEASRHTAARTVNALMTATYWEIGRRIVEFEQRGKERAAYGEQLLAQLSADLTSRFGRGFGRRNLFQIRAFYLAYRSIVQTSSAQLVKEQTLSAQSGARILSTPSIESTQPIVSTASIESQRKKGQTSYGELPVHALAARFPLPWSHISRTERRTPRMVRIIPSLPNKVLAREYNHHDAELVFTSPKSRPPACRNQLSTLNSHLQIKHQTSNIKHCRVCGLTSSFNLFRPPSAFPLS